jgi:nucleoporin GLE1
VPTPQPKAPEPAATPQPPQTTTTTPTAPTLVSPDVDRYLETHRNLKQMRAFILDAGKQDKALKTKTGDMRRAIRQSLGQLTGEKGANKTPVRTNH